MRTARHALTACCRVLGHVTASAPVLVSVALLILADPAPLFAQLSSVPPFVGSNSETWERFGAGHLPSGTSILGGIATIAGFEMETAKTFQMCSVFAKPSDGQILMYAERGTGPTTLSFSQPVSAFGAYWGTGYRCARYGFDDAEIILTFYDANNNVVGSDSFAYIGDGILAWHGYNFSRPVWTITRMAADGAEGFAFDGLQATVASTGGSPAQFQNISTRMQVGLGDAVLIGGFIVQGSGNKKLMVRGIGPSLTSHGLSDALADPVVELHDASGATIATNDNWQTTQIGGVISADQTADIQASGLAPSNSAESAMIVTLSPGQYTAIVRGTNNQTGIALVELYDLDQNAPAKFANISTRGSVQTGDDVMIGGLILVGSDSAKIIARALGPSLVQAGVSGAMADPTLELRDGNGALVRSNDNWRDTQEAEIQATGIAPSNDLESAIVATIAAGNYTAIVAGKNAGTGVGLVELYKLQ